MLASLFAFRRAEKAGFRHAPITVPNGLLLARTQNTKIGPRDKPLQEELTVVDAFLRLKRWAILDCPSGQANQRPPRPACFRRRARRFTFSGLSSFPPSTARPPTSR